MLSQRLETTIIILDYNVRLQYRISSILLVKLKQMFLPKPSANSLILTSHYINTLCIHQNHIHPTILTGYLSSVGRLGSCNTFIKGTRQFDSFHIILTGPRKKELVTH